MIVSIVATTALLGVLEAACPLSGRPRGDDCIFDLDVKLGFMEARKVCRSLNSTLDIPHKHRYVALRADHVKLRDVHPITDSNLFRIDIVDENKRYKSKVYKKVQMHGRDWWILHNAQLPVVCIGKGLNEGEKPFQAQACGSEGHISDPEPYKKRKLKADEGCPACEGR